MKTSGRTWKKWNAIKYCLWHWLLTQFFLLSLSLCLCSATSLETANALIEHDLQNALIAINPLNGTSAAFAVVNGSPPISTQPPQIACAVTTQCQNGTTTTSHSGSSGRSTPTATSSGTDPAPGKLFVGGLSWQTSMDKLREYFGMFGTVTDVLIMKDPITQVCGARLNGKGDGQRL